MILNFYTMVKRLGFKGSLIFLGACGLIWFIGLGIMFAIFDRSHPDLNQAQQVLYQMMGEENLRAVGFFEMYPDGKPSDFMAFVETEAGSRLWPPSVSEFRASAEGQAGQRAGRILRPDDVGFSAYQVDPSLEKQVVYIPDDQEEVIEFQGYLSPHEGPVQTSRWEFPSSGKKIRF